MKRFLKNFIVTFAVYISMVLLNSYLKIEFFPESLGVEELLYGFVVSLAIIGTDELIRARRAK